jgi:hypothetical protein
MEIGRCLSWPVPFKFQIGAEYIVEITIAIARKISPHS